MNYNQKKINLNGITTKVSKLTAQEMIMFVEDCKPEDKKRFASLVFSKQGERYSHFKARKVFCELFFPEVFEEEPKEVEVKISDTIKSWL